MQRISGNREYCTQLMTCSYFNKFNKLKRFLSIFLCAIFTFYCKRFSFEITDKNSRDGRQISITLVLLKSSGMPGRVACDTARFTVSDDAVVARTFRTMPGQSSWREFRCAWRGIRARIVPLLVQTHRRSQTSNFTLHSTRGWRR